MKVSSKTPSQKTQERIKLIESHIKTHRESIKSLQYAYRNKFNQFKKGDMGLRIIPFYRLPFSEKRYQETICNLQKQIVFFEFELTILNKFGI